MLEGRFNVLLNQFAAGIHCQQRRFASQMRHQSGTHTLKCRQLCTDALGHRIADRFEQAIAEKNPEESPHQGSGHVHTDFGDRTADAVHGDDDPQNRRQNSEPRHGFTDLVQGPGRQQQRFVHRVEFLLKETFQFVG